MLKIEEIVSYLKNMNLAAVSRDAGIKQHALWRLTKGKNVAYEIIEKMSDYIESSDKIKTQ